MKHFEKMEWILSVCEFNIKERGFKLLWIFRLFSDNGRVFLLDLDEDKEVFDSSSISNNKVITDGITLFSLSISLFESNFFKQAPKIADTI